MADPVWSFVDLATGEFTGGQAVGGIDVGFAQPAGILPVLGDYPRALWRYDLVAGRVVPKDAPVEQGPSLADRREAVSAAMLGLRVTEAPAMRALIECVLAIHRGEPMPAAAIDRLLEVEGALISLRPVAVQALADLAESTDPNG